jgi:hypothetical protein
VPPHVTSHSQRVGQLRGSVIVEGGGFERDSKFCNRFLMPAHLYVGGAEGVMVIPFEISIAFHPFSAAANQFVIAAGIPEKRCNLSEHNHVFEGAIAEKGYDTVLAQFPGAGQKKFVELQQVIIKLVSELYFSVLGVNAIAGLCSQNRSTVAQNL